MRYNQIIEAKKRASPEGFHDLAKKKYGNRVAALTKDEILSLASDNGLQVPGYVSKQKVGRGLYSVVPPGFLDTDRLMDACREVWQAFKNVQRPYMEDPPEFFAGTSYSKPYAQAGLRDWGRWVMPDGVDDDGDYDWQELSSESATKAGQIVDAVQKKFSDLDIKFSTGEKNWLYTTVYFKPTAL